ncbi:hypothetical protein GOBAR_DD02048 [Gossypium barbadense]|nr:hypothetical protein GOBAR_DD02048 [Gossypium barbadense]
MAATRKPLLSLLSRVSRTSKRTYVTTQFLLYSLKQRDQSYGIQKARNIWIFYQLTQLLIRDIAIQRSSKHFKNRQKDSLSVPRAFYNDRFPVFAERLTSMFGYEMVLPMNTGAEGVETALKLARKWGYEKKKIPKNEFLLPDVRPLAGKAIIVSCCGCFHGRTLAVISMSCDNEATRGFGPLLPGHIKVDFGDAVALEKIFKGYLKAVRDLCSKYNVLMIADEIQSGLARSGKMLACDWEGVRPDVVILGKALGGGVIPVSAVLADKDVMLCIRPGEHGSTFGGNPLASAVAIASLDVIQEEKLAERSAHLGEELLCQLVKIKEEFPNYVKEVRGRGLFTAVEFNSKSLFPVSAYDICLKMKERGVLAKPTHDTIVRLTPPLCMRSMLELRAIFGALRDEVKEGSKVLHDVLELDLPNMQKAKPKDSPTTATICDRCGRNLYDPLDRAL